MRFVGLAAAFFAAAIPAQAAPTCTPYGVPLVLTGTVHRTMFFGSPDFGADDAHDAPGYYPVFKPDRPPHMCAAPVTASEPAGYVARRMQMILPARVGVFAWYGKHVVVTAKLYGWESAWHHTPVMLEVTAIRAGR